MPKREYNERQPQKVVSGATKGHPSIQGIAKAAVTQGLKVALGGSSWLNVTPPHAQRIPLRLVGQVSKTNSRKEMSAFLK